jgi:hypothetical protein
VITTAVVLLPGVGRWCVNGPAYPNERRFLLAVPGPLLLGPVELAWAATVGLPVIGLLMVASRVWVPGLLVLLVAGAAVAVLGRALHGLSRRWVVFVPAGIVLHDPLAVVDPVLFRRAVIESIGPARAGTDALDLTQRALGLTLELSLSEKVPMVRTGTQTGESTRLIFTPTRPGSVLSEARARRLPVGQS